LLQAKNSLYYGDNLDVMRRHLGDESIDLIYLDPPFNSNADYNVLFAEHSGEQAVSQIKGFEDTWTWDIPAARLYEEVVESGGAVSEAMQALRQMLGKSDMMAYVAYMAPRLIELRRILKSKGALYLHCDPTASHYLKLVLDSIFGPKNFLNEIIWKRTYAHGSANRWGDVHDTLLFYSKSATHTWNRPLQAHGVDYLDTKYRYNDQRGRYRLVVLTGMGATKGASGQSWRGYDPTLAGRHWAVPGRAIEALKAEGISIPVSLHDQLELLYKHDFIRFPEKKSGQGVPEFKLYLTEGQPVQDVILDIPPINSQAKERLGYPTQKPEELLARIISASAPPGAVILDPFCGCGTAVAVAERLGHTWIGIDITALAITLIKHRLQNQFGPAVTTKYSVIGEPVSLPDAAQLATDDPYQFQFWALGLVGARPAQTEQKKGADRGIDGNIYFHDDPRGKTKRVILSVKAGANVSVAMVRDLVGTVTREKADIGALISFTPATRPMREEAASAGFYTSPMGGKHPRIQILTIEELLNGKGIDYPARSQRSDHTFKKAQRIIRETENLPLSALITDDGDDDAHIEPSESDIDEDE